MVPPRKGRPIRVVVVDDSPTLRRVVTRLLETDSGISVVGQAGDGAEAVALVGALRPDLVTMDIRMPRKDGFQATKEIMTRSPTPVLIMTSPGDRSGIQVTFETLAAGALDVFEKPVLGLGEDGMQARDRLVKKVRQLSRARPSDRGLWSYAAPGRPEKRMLPGTEGPLRVVAIASSTGGPQVVSGILKALPCAGPPAVLIVQHIASGFSEALAKWLGEGCALEVRLARHADIIHPGLALVAPEELHMEVDGEERIRLFSAEGTPEPCPSADVLFRSVARVFGQRAAGVVLTGMGSDGAQGLKMIRERKGLTLVQSRPTCTIFGMPRAALRLGAADAVLSPQGIAERLAAFCVS